MSTVPPCSCLYAGLTALSPSLSLERLYHDVTCLIILKDLSSGRLSEISTQSENR